MPEASTDREAKPAGSPEDRLVPESHLRELQSKKDREIAELRRAKEASEFQLVQALMTALDEADKVRYAGDDVGYQASRAQRAQVLDQYVAAMQARENQARMEDMARALVIKQMSIQYGVKEEDLAGFHHPADMERYARAMAARRRTERFEARRESKADQAEGSSSSGANPLKGITDELELLRMGYAKKR